MKDAWVRRTVMAAVVLFVLHVVGSWAYGLLGAAAVVPAAPGMTALQAPIALRCPGCGWIEAKREVLPDTAHPGAAKTYEYTLRMRDGSVSLFRETLPTTWRVGERLVLIEGTNLPD